MEVLIWRLTGWVPPAWSNRDYDARIRYWNALYEIAQGTENPKARAMKALAWQD